MDTITNYAQELYGISLFVGIVFLLLGGHLLVEGSVTIAKRLGISTLVIGLTIVAFSTSSPELAFNIISSLNGHGDLSLGNIFGSNIANIGLVLGLGAVICKLPVTGQVVKTEFPLLVLATAIVGLVCYFQGLTVIWSCVLLVLFCFLMWKWFTLGKGKSKVGTESIELVEELVEGKLSTGDFPFADESMAKKIEAAVAAETAKRQAEAKKKQSKFGVNFGAASNLAGSGISDTLDLGHGETIELASAQRIFVFMIGGITHIERRGIYELARRLKREIIVGGTSELDCRKFPTLLASVMP